jgi:hypothetical protein
VETCTAQLDHEIGGKEAEDEDEEEEEEEDEE